MGAFRHSVQTIRNRPFIIWFFGIAALIFCIFDSFNPVIPILFGLGKITKGDISESIISFLQIMLEPGILATLLLAVAAVSIAGAIAAGLVFSGYFYIIKNAVGGEAKGKGEYLTGLRKYFVRVSFINFRVLIFGLLYLLFMMVVLVPAIVVTKAALSDKPQYMLAAVFIDILTAGVWFFGVMFFRAYTLFWYPAAVAGEEKAFSAGRNFANRHFWRITVRFIIFDIVFIVFQLLLMNIKIEFLAFIIYWLFVTVFFSFFTTYIFSLFRLDIIGHNMIKYVKN